MDIAAALADIDEVLANPTDLSGSSMAVVAASMRMHACICRYAPPGSTYRKQADRFIEYHAKSGHNPGNASMDTSLRAVLSTLRIDLSNGKLATFEELIHADVYADLYAQAEGLHRDGYSRAATVVAGAALEEHLKKLAAKHGTGPTRADGTPKKASIINNELRGADVYGEAQRATIEGWQKLRNDAAHGNPGFDGADTSLTPNVTPMIVGARSFVAQYPA